MLLFLFVQNIPAKEINIKKEWKEYNRLERKDQPRKQIKKLHEIRTLALEQRLGEDLLEAG